MSPCSLSPAAGEKEEGSSRESSEGDVAHRRPPIRLRRPGVSLVPDELKDLPYGSKGSEVLSKLLVA